jgi:TetR/AcrR family transcriptional regulator, transcriptional repressor for nem operon
VTRTKPAEQRRAELLAAGQALFLAKGIAGTSLEDITQLAGVSKGLFYLYFSAKEDLVLALQEQFSRDLAARMRAAVEAVEAVPAGPRAAWADRLDACVRAGLERYRDLHDLHEVLFHHAHVAAPGAGQPDTASGAERADPAPAPAARVIRELLADGTAAGAFDVPDPESTAVLCYASMHAFDHDSRGRPGPDDARLIRAAQQLFRRAAGLA